MNKRANDYVKEWLGAYLDGELSADRRAWVEDHLAECPDCRQELTELCSLAALLHADPDPFLERAVSPAAFTAQVVGRLPRPVDPPARHALRVGLRYLPLGLFGAWAFMQTVFWVSSGLLYAMNYFPQAHDWLAQAVPDLSHGAGGWLGGLFSLGRWTGLTDTLGGSFWFLPLVLINLAVIVLLAGMFFAWMAAGWTYLRSQSKTATQSF